MSLTAQCVEKEAVPPWLMAVKEAKEEYDMRKPWVRTR